MAMILACARLLTHLCAREAGQASWALCEAALETVHGGLYTAYLGSPGLSKVRSDSGPPDLLLR
jgi:hypothetical protein